MWAKCEESAADSSRGLSVPGWKWHLQADWEGDGGPIRDGGPTRTRVRRYQEQVWRPQEVITS